MVTGVAARQMQRASADHLAVMAQEIDDQQVAGLANAGGALDHGAQRPRDRRSGVEEVDIDAARAVVAGRHRRGDMAVLARPADAPFIHFEDALGPFFAEELREPLVAQSAAGFERVVVDDGSSGRASPAPSATATVICAITVAPPRPIRLRSARNTEAPRRAASIAAYMPAPPDPMIRTSVSTCMGSDVMR